MKTLGQVSRELVEKYGIQVDLFDGGSMNNLVIVAHADDEILNMGGTLHQWKDEYWKIVCVTDDIEHGRNPQFKQVCKMLKADGVILGYEMGRTTRWDNRKVAKDLSLILSERTWDRVFTHNEEGEYGNAQHKQLHQIVKAKKLPNLYLFGAGIEDVNFRVQIKYWNKKFKTKAAKTYTKKTKAIMAYDFFGVDCETFRRED